MGQSDPKQTSISEGPPGYLVRSAQPLSSLFLLLPLLLAYEGATLWAHAHGKPPPVVARNWVSGFLEMFGAVGNYLPGAAVVITLLVWHCVSKDKIKPKASDVPWMAAESIVLAIPLLVFSVVIGSSQDASLNTGSFGVGFGVVYFFGVGIYEELIFRLLAIAVLHMLFVDAIRMPEKTGAILAILVSSVVFALAHYDPSTGSMGQFVQSPRFVFCAVGGVYLAILYLGRGFGIAAATHGFYDGMTIVVPWMVHGATASG